MRDHEVKIRNCNRCGKFFRSTWSGNRRCSRCEDVIASVYQPPVYSVRYDEEGRPIKGLLQKGGT